MANQTYHLIAKRLWAVAVTVALGSWCCWGATTPAPLKVEVRPSPGGPRILVNGEVRLPRFYYGSPTCLCNIAGGRKTHLCVPFVSDADTVSGRVELTGYEGVDPIWYSDARLIDLAAGTTNIVLRSDEVIRTDKYVARNLTFRKGHRYHFTFAHRASRPRTYFTVSVFRPDDSGADVRLPYYYGDTLGKTVQIASDVAAVNFVTFSTDSSWGCEGWWAPPDEKEDYSKIDRECARLIAINPNILLVPRIMTDAPGWLLRRSPEMRMVFDNGVILPMSSVSSRPYRVAATAAVERLSRHLKETFPRHYAGLQISGQNSAEWFYMLSQSDLLSGYDPATRDAFRLWLRKAGDPLWASAEVPTAGERHCRQKSARALAFAQFRQEEMISFLDDLGAAAKRGSRGEALTFFFYGYSWELGGVYAGASETGHFAFQKLMDRAHGHIDGFSSPMSYSCRNLLGSTVMMSAAESVLRNGYLWFNEIDHRTHHEEMWDHMSIFKPYTDPAITREIMLRDSAADILRGYGDWWMDLFGRGWYQDKDIWRVRAELNALDKAFLKRARPYSPAIANVVDEDCFLFDGWRAGRKKVMNRRGFATCGADYGQYLLEDFLRHPPENVRLVYLTVTQGLSADRQARLQAYRAKCPHVTVVENVTADDLTAKAIAARARASGIHLFTAPGAANVTSAEGYLVVQALEEGPLTLDLGAGTIRTIPFRQGETRILKY